MVITYNNDICHVALSCKDVSAFSFFKLIDIDQISFKIKFRCEFDSDANIEILKFLETS